MVAPTIHDGLYQTDDIDDRSNGNFEFLLLHPRRFLSGET